MIGFRLDNGAFAEGEVFLRAGGTMRKFLGVLGALLLAGSAWAQNGMTVPEGTALKVKLGTTISTFSSKVGDAFQAKVTEPVVVDGKTLIPVGATVEGRITKLNEPGGLRASRRSRSFRNIWSWRMGSASC